MLDPMAAAQREALIVELRAKRLGYREIGLRVGLTHQRCHQIFREVCERIPAERLHEIRLQEGELLDEAIANMLPLAKSDDVSPRTRAELWGKIISASESKRKLFGADAPTRKEVTVLTEDAVDAAIREVNEQHAKLVAQAAAAGVDISGPLTE